MRRLTWPTPTNNELHHGLEIACKCKQSSRDLHTKFRKEALRLWSPHPCYLDARGLVACWRESLLAKAVLSGRTRGYRNHPQLERFRLHPYPLRAINQYLRGIYEEARHRGYVFDGTKIGPNRAAGRISVTSGQARYELVHLKGKLWKRDRRRYFFLKDMKTPMLHPLFRMVPGGKASWER